jgi:AbrB family looped-hinge helix DNA binding protein
MITTVRVQEKGQVTIPRNIRRQLHLKKGDLVTFVSTDKGVVIKTLALAADDLLESLTADLLARGIQLDAILERSQKVSSESLAKEFGLSKGEQNVLYQALQLKAQAAVEAIRATAEVSGSGELTEEDIETEIQEVRKKASHAHRS